MPIISYIGLGSNVGDRKAHIEQARDLLAASAGKMTAFSSRYETEPVGYGEQAGFLNAVVEIETALSPEELLSVCHSIEDRMGRERTVHWGPRTIDCDVLLYGTAVVNTPSLIIPHPRMAFRKFVLVPLAEIAPGALHPQLVRTAAELLKDLKDGHAVVRYEADGSNG